MHGGMMVEMQPETTLYRNEFSTGSWGMLIAVLSGIAIAAVGLPVAILGLKKFGARSTEGIFLIAWSLFVWVGSAKLTWDWFHPKVWAIELTASTLWWQTPSSYDEVSLTDVTRVKIVNKGDIARMWITTSDDTERYVHPNCLENVEQLGHALQMHFPEVLLDFSGFGEKNFRA